MCEMDNLDLLLMRMWRMIGGVCCGGVIGAIAGASHSLFTADKYAIVLTYFTAWKLMTAGVTFIISKSGEEVLLAFIFEYALFMGVGALLLGHLNVPAITDGLLLLWAGMIYLYSKMKRAPVFEIIGRQLQISGTAAMAGIVGLLFATQLGASI